MPDLAARAAALLELHTPPEILTLANVWDVVSAQVVASTDGVRALATASHSIAATFGYEDGENIPLDLHHDAVAAVERSSRSVRKLTVISVPGASLPVRELQELGVARVSTGAFTSGSP